MTAGEIKKFLSIITENSDEEEVEFKIDGKLVKIEKFTIDINHKATIELTKRLK